SQGVCSQRQGQKRRNFGEETAVSPSQSTTFHSSTNDWQAKPSFQCTRAAKNSPLAKSNASCCCPYSR
ncbi:hypothetical protein KI387_040935, partial [Taxus chinensis]